MSEMYIQLRTEVRRNIRRTENDGVIREEFEGVASARRQLRSWLSPGGWIRGLTVCDIQRDSGSIEVPDGNAFIVPFHGVNATSLGVKVGSIGSSTPFCDATSRITGDCAITIKISNKASGEIVVGCQITTWARVPRDLVVLVVVHTFENINFAPLQRS
jgi:hypothetical protein